ncbi:MAG: hypothetical protein AAFU79_35400, partial [Myxococcota bacterium]
MAQMEAIILGQGRDQRPRPGGSRALAEDVRRSWFESGDLRQRSTDRGVELLAGMAAMESRDAVDQATCLRFGGIVREKLDVDTELAQVMNDEGSVTEGLVDAPTPEQGGLPGAEKTADRGDR